MRESVMMKLGARELPLRPAFSVVDAFEDRHRSLLEHLERLMGGKATLRERAFLITEGLKAADDRTAWDVTKVMELLFDQGFWHEDLVMKEAEFVERLLYTPEQFLEKKRQRADEAERLQTEWEGVFGSSSDSQSST